MTIATKPTSPEADEDEELSAPSLAVKESEYDDIDPAEWLELAKPAEGFVIVPGTNKRVKIVTLTDDDLALDRKFATNLKVVAGKRVQRFDDQVFRRTIIAHAINKARGMSFESPGAWNEATLRNSKPGHLLDMANQVLALSGFVDDDERDPAAFSG